MALMAIICLNIDSKSSIYRSSCSSLTYSCSYFMLFYFSGCSYSYCYSSLLELLLSSFRLPYPSTLAYSYTLTYPFSLAYYFTATSPSSFFYLSLPSLPLLFLLLSFLSIQLHCVVSINPTKLNTLPSSYPSLSNPRISFPKGKSSTTDYKSSLTISMKLLTSSAIAYYWLHFCPLFGVLTISRKLSGLWI